VNALIDRLPKVEGTPGEIHISQRSQPGVQRYRQARATACDQFIASELFVLAAFDDRNLARVFKDSGINQGRRREGD